MTQITRAVYQDGGYLIVKKQQDTSAILDHNKSWSNEISQRGNARRVASIPTIIVEQLMKSGVWWDKAAMKKWLNDPDNRYFRTDGGKRL